MPRASAAAAAQTAEHVLSCATELFAAQGFADVALDDVAAAASVTRGAIYHHFTNKVGLFRAVVDRLQQHVAEAVASAAEAAGAEPWQQLVAGSHAFLEAITHGSAPRVLLIDAPSVLGWSQWREIDATHSGSHLIEVLRDVGVPDTHLPAMAAQLSGAMNDAALFIIEHDDADSRAAAHAVLDQLLRVALPPQELPR